ncbi:hypothetical protein MAFF301069_46750 (plasmid) [Ralstonia pseudosolanacearum]|nr:hypothetical protein MAFF301069_46750 [Ralstonia pseudosolanacearum]
MTRSTFVYVTYIRTTPQTLWSALTDAEFMKQYWFGMHCESQWTAGSAWRLVSGDGQVFDTGEIVEADPPRRLVIRWLHQSRPELKAEGASQCTMELEPTGTAVKLSYHPHHRARSVEAHRGGVRRVAEDSLQPQVPAGNRLHCSAGPLPHRERPR